MLRSELIQIAEDVGLLTKNEDYPYSLPAHQRLISQLEKYAIRIARVAIEEYIESLTKKEET